jgi:hypothetical protein
MTYPLVVVAVAVAVAVAVGIYLLAKSRRRARKEPGADPTVSEFSALPEPARCEMVFAAASLEDEGSVMLLRFALDDPSEAVTLAAARALVGRGLAQTVDEYLERHPGDRTERIARTLALISQR